CPPGPGFWESIGWLAGMHVASLAGFVGGMVFLAVVFATTHPLLPPDARPGTPYDPTTFLRGLGPYIEHNLGLLVGVAGVGTTLSGVLAVGWRLRRQQGMRGLGIQLPSIGHVALIAMVMLPLSLLCSELQSAMFKLIPAAKTSMNELFHGLAN